MRKNNKEKRSNKLVLEQVYLDIVLIDNDTKKVSGRPILEIGYDADSQKILWSTVVATITKCSC